MKILLATICFLLFLQESEAISSIPTPKDYILILNSHGSNNNWSVGITQNIIKSITATGSSIALNIENLNLNRTNDFHIWIERMSVALKSNRRPPHIIILIGDEAWMTYQYVIKPEWKDIPLILCGVKRYSIDLKDFLNTGTIKFDQLTSTETTASQYNATGILESYEVKKTILLMQQLIPEMKQLAFISDNSYSGVYAQLVTQKIIHESFPDLPVNYLDGRYLDGESLQFLLSSLHKDTGILLHGWLTDARSNTYPERYFHDLIYKKLKSPLFTLGDIGMQTGSYLGGYFPDNQNYGQKTANLIMNILRGNSPRNIPFSFNTDYQYHLSQKNLIDNHIPTRLWPDKAVYYQIVPSFYEQHYHIIYLVTFFLLLLIATLGGTLAYLYNIRKLKNHLAESLIYYRNLYESLLLQSREGDEKEAIQKILKSALKLIGANYVYIAINEPGKEYSNDFYMLHHAPNGSFREEIIKKFPMPKEGWWMKQLEKGQTYYIDSVKAIKNLKQKEEVENFASHIQSFIVCPLISDNVNIGHFSIGITQQTHHWSQPEIEWFESLARIINSIKEQQKRKRIRTESLDNIRRSEKRFRSIFDHLPVGAALYDQNAFLIDANDSILEIMGVASKDGMLGRNIQDNPSLPDDLKQAIKRGEYISRDIKYDFPLVNASKHFISTHTGLRDFHFIYDTLRNLRGEIEGYMLLLIDNTDKYATFRKIQELESLFSYASSYTDIGVGIWNPISNTGFATKEWYKNIGEEEQAKLHSDIFECRNVHPDDRKKLLEFARKIMDGKLDSMMQDVRVKTEKGWKWTKQHIIMKEYDPTNNNIQIVGLNMNIDTQKAQEEELIQAKQKAEESDKLKTAFLANISHEIRTPLNAIVGFSELLNEAETIEEKQKYTKIIERNTDLLLQLISDILDLSTIEAGTMEFVYEQVDLQKLVTDLQNAYHPKVTPGVKLIPEPELIPFRLFTDKSRLHQILSNFISNAIKFTSSGNIRFGYKLQENRICFYVSDTGCGISEQNLPKVFDRFIKVNKFVEGTGLGLSINKTIVEKLGGTIGVESELGSGSTFWFTIPVE